MRKSYFITGTSTGVGKTRSATGILAGVSRLGFSTAGFKPVAAGCERTTDGLQNGDAQKLLSQTSLSLSYEKINMEIISSKYDIRRSSRNIIR